MASYNVLFKKSVAKDLRSIPRPDLVKVLSKISKLKDNPRPHGCEK